MNNYHSIDSNIYIPLKGIKKKLLDMAYNNAKINLDNNFETITRDIKRTNAKSDTIFFFITFSPIILNIILFLELFVLMIVVKI